MCRRHWSILQKPVKSAIWREYRPGQELDKRPSAAYMAVQQWAIGLVAFKPGDESAAQASTNYILRAAVFRTLAMGGGGADPLRGLVPSGAEIPDIPLDLALELEA